MRLFFVNMHKLWGGQSAVVVLLAEELQRRGHEVLVAGLQGSELIKRAAASGLKTYDELELRRGVRLGAFFRDQVRLKQLFQSFAPHGILTNGSQDTWACGLARRRLRQKMFLVRWRHNSFKISTHLFNRWLYRDLIDHVTVSSPEIAPLLTAERLVDPERITVFPPTTRLERFLAVQPGANLRTQLGLPAKAVLVLSVGRLAPEKDHLSLLRAWKLITQKNDDAHLLIAGHGSQQQAIEAEIEKLALRARVHLLGFRDDIPALYAQADLAALTPNAGESFGIALLEAFATGIPCLATDVGGVKDLVLDGQTGYLVSPGATEAIAAGLLKLIENPAERKRMGEAGRSRVLEKFTPARLADQAEALFMRLAMD